MSSQIKVMSCTNHSSKLALTLGWIGPTVPKWTETASAGVRFGGQECGILIRRDRLRNIAGDTCSVQGLGNPALTIATPGQGRGARLGETPVIDISGRCTTRYDRVDRRGFIPAPSPLGYFPAKIIREPLFRGREPAEVMNGQRIETGRIEWADWTGSG